MSFNERRTDCKVCHKPLTSNQLIYCSDDHREEDYALKQKKRYADRASIPSEGKLQCKICGKWYKHLGSHIAHGHKMLAKDYKEEYGLPYKMALISNEVHDKMSEAFWADPEEAQKRIDKNLQGEGSEGRRFKKGQTGQRRISQHEREVNLKRILDFNERKKGKLEPCPVCHMKYNHLASHLALKHKLLMIK